MEENVALLLGLGLLGAAFLLIFAELFIPSGGLIAIGAAVSAVAGIVILFMHNGPVWGLIGVGVVLVGTPVTLNVALKIWPSTPIGRWMLMGETTEADVAAKEAAEVAARERRRALVGAEGEVLTPLRPVGMVKIGDQRFDALADSGIIESGQRVRVTEVTDNQLKVRAI